MEDFRQISRIAEIRGHRFQNFEDAGHLSLSTLPPRLNLRRVLLSLTVVILGMAAWWGL